MAPHPDSTALDQLRQRAASAISASEADAFRSALTGTKRELDDWLECHDEESVRLHIASLLNGQQQPQLASSLAQKKAPSSAEHRDASRWRLLRNYLTSADLDIILARFMRRKKKQKA